MKSPLLSSLILFKHFLLLKDFQFTLLLCLFDPLSLSLSLTLFQYHPSLLFTLLICSSVSRSTILLRSVILFHLLFESYVFFRIVFNWIHSWTFSVFPDFLSLHEWFFFSRKTSVVDSMLLFLLSFVVMKETRQHLLSVIKVRFVFLEIKQTLLVWHELPVFCHTFLWTSVSFVMYFSLSLTNDMSLQPSEVLLQSLNTHFSPLLPWHITIFSMSW